MAIENIGRALSHGWTAVDSDVVPLRSPSHEAIIRQAYRDLEGVWTWSVGITSGPGHGVERYIGKPQPLSHCLAVYAWALNRYAEAGQAAFNGYPLTKAQFTAALSFRECRAIASPCHMSFKAIPGLIAVDIALIVVRGPAAVAHPILPIERGVGQ
jgi:hypothetical protein